jgi:hypothetical protein
VKKNSFGLLELEMADLERFWRKTPLGPLGVNFFIYSWLNVKFFMATEYVIRQSYRDWSQFLLIFFFG